MTDPGRAALAAAWAVAQIGSQDWNNYCELLAEQAYGTRGQYPTAAAAGGALVTHQARPAGHPLDGAQPGDLLFFRADESNGQAGHAGIYLGGDEMVSATPTGVKRTKILTDSYYGPRFAGWGPAPESWQGPASTPQLVKGAADLIAAAQGASGPSGQKGTNMAGEPRQPTALEQEYQRQLTEHQDRLAPLQQQVDEAQALVDAYTRDKDIPNSKWLPAHGVTMDDVAAAQTLLADVRLKRGDVGKALASEQAAIDLAQKRLSAETQRADAEAAKAAAFAARTPAASSQYLNTDASDQFIIARNPDGTIKMKPDGSGPETMPNPNYRPPAASTAATKAQEPRFFTRADGSVIVTDADGSNGRVLLTSDKTPGTMTDPTTGDVYLQGPDGRPSGPPVFSGKPPIQTTTNNGIVTGVNTQTGAQAWQTDLRTDAQKAKEALDAAQAQYEGARTSLVNGLLDQVQAGSLEVAGAQKQLADFDQVHQSRAEALSQQQEQRLASAAQETVRANQAREAEAARTAAETARANQETEQTNRATIAQRAADTATTAETARQKVIFPAAQAVPALQPIYDAFSGGTFPTGAAFSPTVFPHRESPQDVGQHVFDAVMQRLAPHSPIAADYVRQQGGGPPGPPGPPGLPGSTTQSTTGTPAQASLLNAITASGALAPPGQQSGLPPAPAAYGGSGGSGVDPAATLPPMQSGQPINPWRTAYPAAYG